MGVSGIEAKFCFDLSGEFFFHRIVLLYSYHLGQGAHSLGLLVFSESLDSGQGRFFVGIKLNMVHEILWSWNLIRYQESCGHRAPGLLSLHASCWGKEGVTWSVTVHVFVMWAASSDLGTIRSVGCYHFRA